MKILSKKNIIIVVLLLVLTGAFFIYRKNSLEAAKNGVKTAKVKRENLTKYVSASGKIVALKEVELKFQASGQLVWVGVSVGDFVEPYQAIAQLDVRKLELDLKKELRDYSGERWDFEEDRQITYRDSVLTDTIKRILEKNQFDLDKAVADVEITDIALKFATLVTPIGGVVTSVDTPVAGVNITAATAVFKVSDPDSLVFQAEVDEVDIAKIKEGQKVMIVLDAFSDNEIESYVDKIAYSAKTTSGGGTAFLVDISLPINVADYRIGMNGDVDIIVNEKDDVLVVDYDGIREEKGKKFVYVLNENGGREKRPVKTGLESVDEVEIIEGVKEGEKVVVGKIE